MVNELLVRNGYKPNPPKTSKNKVSRKHNRETDNYTILTLPYTTEGESKQVRAYLKKRKLPIKPVFLPGRTLRSTLTASRPLDSPTCSMNNPEICKQCPLIDKGKGGCNKRGVVYKLQCNKCNGTYIGEAYRKLHDRFGDHLRAAKHPSSYPTNAMGQHYDQVHPSQPPDISLTTLGIERKTVRRKALEAVMITSHAPTINDKLELQTTVTHTCPPPP